MSSLLTASEADICVLAAIVTAEREDLPAHGLPPSLLSDLMGQIRCDAVAFLGFDSGRQIFWFGQELPEDDRHCRRRGRGGGPGALAALLGLPSLQLPGPDRGPARRGEDRGLLLGPAVALQRHVRRHVPAAGDPADARAAPARAARAQPRTRPDRPAVLFRLCGPDFSERDRALLTLIRPHLHQAYLDAERRRASVSPLTPRQTGLLRLVADGHTNAQIARRLGVSDGTVRTHLENIYGRLQVSSRTAAVRAPSPARWCRTRCAPPGQRDWAAR